LASNLGEQVERDGFNILIRVERIGDHRGAARVSEATQPIVTGKLRGIGDQVRLKITRIGEVVLERKAAQSERSFEVKMEFDFRKLPDGF